jgi:hypothetical protein
MNTKRHWGWNFLIVITIIICALAFLAHAKNWTRLQNDQFRILSGIYYTQLKYSDLDSVNMVPKIPQLERMHGFSAGEMEKGVFRDSLKPDNRVGVYVDNLLHPKIRIVHNDSLYIYLNFSDSLKTVELFHYLEQKIDSARTPEPK